MYNLVCLCGSTRFLAEFTTANQELTKRGISVLTISMALPKNAYGQEDTAGLKELLDLVHLNKIMRSDGIFVVGDGYIGRSTAREILWAHMQDKWITSEWNIRQYIGSNREESAFWDCVAEFATELHGDQHEIVDEARKVLGL